jgi:hypothetical protein
MARVRLAMPLDLLARAVIERERKREGFPPPDYGMWMQGRN